MKLLEVVDLRVSFETPYGQVRAVDGVSFEVDKREVVGLVGESGSGKSTLGLSIIRLLPPNARVLSGRVLFDGRELLSMPERELRKIRGREIAMIFQDPMTTLNPTMRAGEHIAEALVYHYGMSWEEAMKVAGEALEAVGIPAERAMDYPHQMSGGMRQRVMIAAALALKPKLIIADEPTSALDVIVQNQILDLLRKLRDESGASVILITHDLSVTADLADRVLIMYAGNIMEAGSVEQIYYGPLHPYTQGLLKSIPRLGHKGSLHLIPGQPPDMTNPPPGCRFHPRCESAMPTCREEAPPAVEVEPGHLVACWLYAKR